MLIDTHAHINDSRLLPLAEEISLSLNENNLSAVINVGYDRATSEVALNLANEYGNFYATVGIHPHDSKDLTESDIDFFISVAKNPKVVAIGETGLDYFYNHSPKEAQKDSFIKHIALANLVKLPLVVHIRDAYEDAFNILNEHKNLLNHGTVLHCYSGSAEMAKRFLTLNDSVYFSFGGAITFKNADKESVVKSIPLPRILLETDCPYMSPQPHRGRTNYPKYINFVCEKMNSWFENADLGQITTENAKRLFIKLRNAVGIS
ncbi:MAG: TatD family hydrolase [Firmicutes bacterium]|nr:TatD family hydrolase [Bacillota bacterium]